MLKFIKSASAATLATFAVAQNATASNSTAASNSTSDETIIDVDDRAGFSCYFWSDYMLFDLSALQKTTGDYHSGFATWNYCAFARIPANVESYGVSDTFAYMWNSKQMVKALPMTNDDLILDETEVSQKTNTTRQSVTVAKDSETKCPYHQNKTTSFVSKLVCNKDITGQGLGKVTNVDYTTDPCVLSVTVEHAAACPTIDISGIHSFLTAAKWVVGIIFVVAGPFIGMFGKRWFPWVVAIGAAFVGCICFLLFFTVVGWMGSTAGFWCLLILSIGLAVLIGWLTKKAVWFEVGILGVLGGWFGASYLYSVIVAASGWESLALYWTMEILCCIAAGICAWKFARTVVMVSTSGCGAYLFCRGCGYLFGGWPSDAALMGGNAEFVEFEVGFWVYMALTIVLFGFFMGWQIKMEKGKDNEELDNHFKKYDVSKFKVQEE